MPKGSAILCISLMQSVCYIRLPSFRDLTCSGLSITITLDSIIKSTESKVRRFYRVAKHEILTRNMPRKSIVGNTGCLKMLFFAIIGNYLVKFITILSNTGCPIKDTKQLKYLKSIFYFLCLPYRGFVIFLTSLQIPKHNRKSLNYYYFISFLYFIS